MGGTVGLVNVTIAENAVASGGAGGGIDVNSGTVTLDNTIVALNTNGSRVVASDIAGTVAVAGSFNLIGTGGAGGLTNGTDGNLVGVVNPGLGVHAKNGGPTQTIALLPGSPAIGKGSSTIAGVTVPTTDQRGVARPSNGVDIGAFQDRGFSITIATGLSQQTAAINTAFANPIAVLVASPFGDPVHGGTITITLTAASGGAAANLSATSATIAASGLASVTAVANGTVGSYTATASSIGVATPAVFALTNLAHAVSVTGVSVGWGPKLRRSKPPPTGFACCRRAGRPTYPGWGSTRCRSPSARPRR